MALIFPISSALLFSTIPYKSLFHKLLTVKGRAGRPIRRILLASVVGLPLKTEVGPDLPKVGPLELFTLPNPSFLTVYSFSDSHEIELF